MSGIYVYNVGGSLPIDSPSYVTRQADQALYQALAQGNLCYVFNARQMGKTSLLANTKRRLQAKGVVCATLDLSVKSQKFDIEKWYAGLISRLAIDLELSDQFNLFSWWQETQFNQPDPTL